MKSRQRAGVAPRRRRALWRAHGHRHARPERRASASCWQGVHTVSRRRESARRRAAASRGLRVMSAPEPGQDNDHRHEEGRFNLSAWALRHQALVVFLIALATVFGILAVHAARAIGRPAVHVPRDGDPHLLAGRDRAAGAGTGHRPHRPQVAGNAVDRFPAQLFAPRRVAAVLHDEGRRAAEGRARRRGTRCARRSAISRRRCRKACRVRSSTTSSATSTRTSTRSKATAFRRRNCTTTPTNCARCCCACRASRKVDYFGDPDQHVYIEIANTQLTRLNISPQQIAQAINAQNASRPPAR